MTQYSYDIQIISAASILGLKPSGVEKLGEALLKADLQKKIKSELPVVSVSHLNHLYSDRRDIGSNCLNTKAVIEFSENLIGVVHRTLMDKHFALVLGGDCSILLGIMPALKQQGNYGLIFIDAHADFYLPHQSPTGEAADMDLAIVCGHGPEALTNIQHRKPYVNEKNVIHVGQRDAKEVEEYDGIPLAETSITSYDLGIIRQTSIGTITEQILDKVRGDETEGYWIHFDTDVLSDAINPAVDYRLPGGLTVEETSYLLHRLLRTGKMAGMSVTIFNPALDKDGSTAKAIVDCLEKSFHQDG